jgi:hypothetical protein
MEAGTSVLEDHTASVFRIEVSKFGEVAVYTEVKGSKKWVMEWNMGMVSQDLGWGENGTQGQNMPVGNIGPKVQNNSNTAKKVHLFQQGREGAPPPVRKVQCSGKNRGTSLSFLNGCALWVLVGHSHTLMTHFSCHFPAWLNSTLKVEERVSSEMLVPFYQTMWHRKYNNYCCKNHRSHPVQVWSDVESLMQWY